MLRLISSRSLRDREKPSAEASEDAAIRGAPSKISMSLGEISASVTAGSIGLDGPMLRNSQLQSIAKCATRNFFFDTEMAETVPRARPCGKIH